jgi:hypothetical protein
LHVSMMFLSMNSWTESETADTQCHSLILGLLMVDGFKAPTL